MPDINDLDHFDEGLPVHPLPASEVRRRGDRMRRRNTVLATVGGVAAAAIFIGTPVALVAAGDNGDDVQPAPSPSSPTAPQEPEGGWMTAIPDSFPLASGFPKTSEGTTATTEPNKVSLVHACGGDAWLLLSGHTSATAVDYRGESENRENRTLVLYPDDSAAREEVAMIRSNVLECPTSKLPSDEGTSIVYETVDLDLGTEETFVFTEQVQHEDGLLSDLTVTEIARSGNALLFVSSYGSAGGPDAVAFETNRLRDAAEAPLAAMCMFSAEPCATPTPSEMPSTEPPPSPSAELADFPLDEGYPETHGTDGSPVEVTGKPGVGVVEACDKTVWSPETDAVDDLIGVEYVGEAEDFRARTLAVYESEQAAEDAVAAALAAVEACPIEKHSAESGGETHLEVRDNDLGDQSVVWTARFTSPEGLMSTGLTVYHLVRVGDAVYASYESGEGGGSEDSVLDAIQRATDQARPIVEAMREL